MPPARIVFWIATLAAFALVARSLVVGPVPVGIAAIAMTGYVALVLVGVFFLNLQMYVDATLRGPDDARGVALTFDDGPHPVHTRTVLDALDAAGVRATFFVVGRKVRLFPEIVREIAERGHAIGIHGDAHSRFMSTMTPRRAEEDLLRALAAVEDATGERPFMFRPPVGHTSPRLAKAIGRLGLVVVGWSARGYDGLRGADPERVAARVIGGLRDRAIVLLHDASENDDHEPASIAVLPRILAAMKERELAAVRVDAWVDVPQRAIAGRRVAS